MKVKICPVGILKRHIGGKDSCSLEIPIDSSVREALTAAKIPPDEVMAVSVNKEREDKDYSLSEGDEILLIPFIGGG
ncbi:MAG: MoaD/ThiS family protein [bacterium]